MKPTLSLFLVLFSFAAFAQAPKVIYFYDDGGNRIQRRVIQLYERLADTTATEETAQEEPPVIEDGSIAAYPTVGAVNISISPNLLENETAEYLLVDLSGREVRRATITQSKTVLDITAEANGNYILTVFVGERKEEWQIVKQ